MDLSNFLVERTRKWQYATTNWKEDHVQSMAFYQKSIATDLEVGFQ